MFPDILTELFEIIRKVLLPGKGTDRVRCKRDQIGCDPEEEQVAIFVICKDFFETREVFLYNIPQLIV